MIAPLVLFIGCAFTILSMGAALLAIRDHFAWGRRPSPASPRRLRGA